MSTVRTTPDVFASLSAMSLEAVLAVADLQVRTDRKYLIDPGDLPLVIDAVAPEARVLAIDGLTGFRYESMYFDTPDLRTYLAAARSRPRRYKVRTRSYLDSETCQLEVKVRAPRDQTVKHRYPYNFDIRDAFTLDARRFVASVPEVDGSVDHLAPTLRTSYRRSTLVLSSTATRVTIDVGLSCARPDGTTMTLGSVVFIETKTQGPPCSLDRVLWRTGYRPAAASKYCIGLAALVPGLPSNKWHRLLRRLQACG